MSTPHAGTVFVDTARNPFGRMIMCHMLSHDIEALHAMAQKIGISRKHFQERDIPHYDICIAKRRLAIERGAVEITRQQVGAFIKEYRTNHPL